MTSVEIVLLTVGIAAVAVSGAGVLLARTTLLRLHYLGPASSLGAPLLVAALAIHEGLSSSAVKLVLIGILVVGSGAVTVSALGRAAAQREGLVDTESSR